MLFEQTAIIKKQEETITSYLEKFKNQDPINPDLVFRDPYFPGSPDHFGSLTDVQNSWPAPHHGRIL
jgi:hypothetical protein